MGLLGQSIFKRHEIVFDLVNQTIQLLPLDIKGQLLLPHDKAPAYQIPFKMGGHIPNFEIQIGQLQLTMGLDSGAEFNVIDAKYANQLSPNMHLRTEGYLTDGGHRRLAVLARLHGMQVDSLVCSPMMTVFGTMKSLNRSIAGKKLDGFLGVEFLLQYRMSINFKKKILYVWERA